jgi:hypothetical protein
MAGRSNSLAVDVGDGNGLLARVGADRHIERVERPKPHPMAERESGHAGMRAIG